MAFEGFSVRALDFYDDLEQDNTKSFWTAHKAVYETEVRDPMLALVAELEPEFGPAKLFRPYRDVRFAKDKTPYKTHQGAFVGTDLGVGWYVEVNAAGLRVGGGYRAHSQDQIERYRAAVASELTGPALDALVAGLRADGFDILGDRLKTKPRGYDADHPRIELLKQKSLMAIKQYDNPPWLESRKTLDVVRDAWRAVRPTSDWIATHVGPA